MLSFFIYNCSGKRLKMRQDFGHGRTRKDTDRKEAVCVAYGLSAIRIFHVPLTRRFEA